MTTRVGTATGHFKPHRKEPRQALTPEVRREALAPRETLTPEVHKRRDALTPRETFAPDVRMKVLTPSKSAH